jgi:hypothetical protein
VKHLLGAPLKGRQYLTILLQYQPLPYKLILKLIEGSNKKVNKNKEGSEVK